MSESNSNQGAPPGGSGETSGPQPLGQSPKLQGGISAEDAVRRLSDTRAGRRPPAPRAASNGAAPAVPPTNGAAPPPAPAPAGADPLDTLINAFRAGGGDAPPPSAAPTNQYERPVDAPIKLTIDGREQEFTREQLVANHHRAADYTKKAQALADLNRQVTERAQAIEKMLPVLVPEIERQIAALDAQLGQRVDWDTLARTDPAEYMRQDALHKAQSAERERLAALSAMREQETEQARNRRLVEGHAELVRMLPGWDNPQTRGRLQSDMIRWGRQNGFSDQELSGIYEPRHVMALFKAMAFDHLMAGVKSDAPPVPNVQRRGTAPPPAASRPLNDAERRFADSHSMRDAIAVLNARRRVH